MTNAQHVRSAHSSSRRAWLGSGSALAAAIALAAVPSADAHAQSIPVAPRANATVAAQGTPVVESGGVSITQGAVKDQVIVSTPTAIINWTTLDTATLATTSDYVNFLPTGTEIEFSGIGADYAVLNRIFSAPDASGAYRGIAFDGTVTSLLGSAGPVGGTVWFYGPGGMLIGPNAVFNVGNLLLTTSAPDPAGLASGVIDLTGVSSATSAITIDPGASLNALNTGSYIAVVAPRVVQNGDVTVNGSAAYVGAEQATLTINASGLFDIAIPLGTEDPNGVVHGGTTTGSASTGFGDGRSINLVAVPKNDAITMLVGGQLGFAPAAAAAVTENGHIVLSAGAEVDSGFITPFIDTTTTTPNASIDVGGTSFTSSVDVFASDTFEMRPEAGETVTFGSDPLGSYGLDVVGAQTIVTGAGAGGVLTTTGNLNLGRTAQGLNEVDVQFVVSGPDGVNPGGIVNIGGDLTIDASSETDVGVAKGGNVLVQVDSGAVLNVGGTLVADASGAGNAEPGSGSGSDGPLGNDGAGGSITMNIAGGFSANTLVLDASGRGGTGGSGDVGFNGGAGGAGTGGDIALNVSGDFQVTSLTMDAQGFGGFAGDGGDGGNGGNGGSAQGGSALLTVDNSAGNIFSIQIATIDASAQGGSGGFGGFGDAVTAGGTGGIGGNALGGTAGVITTGAGTTLAIDPFQIAIAADGAGGTGGSGGGNFLAGTAGNGGLGGDGTGGTTLVEAQGLSTLTLIAGSGPYQLSASGLGGAGGAGGDIDMTNGGIAGDGGDGGTGTGGSPTLSAVGGTITGTDFDLLGTGTGGAGGTGGTDFTVVLGANGNGGAGAGGLPQIRVFDGSPGVITLGAVTIDASGIGGGGTIVGLTTGGSITLTDASADPAGLITMSSLVATALGLVDPGQAGFTLTAGSGPVTVLGSATVNTVGDILFAFDGDGQLLVGGSTQLTSGGDITVLHTNYAGPVFSIDSVDDFIITAGGNFLSDVGSILNGQLDVDLRADGTADINDIRAFRNMFLSSGLGMVINNASNTGPAGTGFIVANAGQDSTGPTYNPAADLTVTGLVTSPGSVGLGAGGSVIFAAGSTTSVDNTLQVVSGDDIIVETGALVEASGAGLAVLFQAGGLAGSLSAPALTPISSIVIDGEVGSNTATMLLLGDAIDGLDGTVSGNFIVADINNAPAAGAPQSDDAGLLDPLCVEGNVCLGSIISDGVVAVGQASPNGVIEFIGGGDSMSADVILITTREGLELGAAGAATTIDAITQIALTSTTGDVTLTDTTITSDTILIDAAGSLLGTGSLSSFGDTGITVGGDIIAASIDTGGQLTTVANIGGALEPFYSAPGDFLVDTVIVRTGDLAVDAAGDIGILDAQAPVGSALLDAAGANSQGSVIAAADIGLSGTTVSFADLLAGGAVDIFSTAGDVTGVGPGTVSAGGDVAISSAAGVTVPTIVTPTIAVISAVGAIGVGTLQATDADIVSTGGSAAVTTDALVSNLLAIEGNSVSVVASGDLAILPTANAGNVDVASGGDLTAIGGFASGALNLDATGTAVIDGLVSGLTISIAAADLDILPTGALGEADFTQAISLLSRGDVTLGGAGGGFGFELDAAEVARIFSGGDLSIATAPSGFILVDDVTVNAGAGTSPTDGTIGQNGTLLLIAGGEILVPGNLTVANATAGTTLALDAGTSIHVDSATGGLFVLDAAGGIAGTIDIVAQDFYAVTSAALEELAGLNIIELDARLALSDGVNRPDGVIRAGTLSIDTTASDVFIQNTVPGTAFDERRGFEVNALSISDSGGTIQPIVINGTVGGNTGVAAIAPASIGSSFDRGSTINGCLIISPTACIPGGNPGQPIDDPTRDLVGEDLTPGEGDPGDKEPGDVGSFGSMLIELRPLDEFSEDPLIDQPVTGAGNEDLWVDPDACAPGAADEACEFGPAG